MIQGALFDMDGVLFDTERVHGEIQKIVSLEMDAPFPDEMISQVYGSNHESYVKLVRKYIGEAFDLDYFLKECRKRIYEKMDREGIPVKPGVQTLLEYLKENKYRVAVASSSHISVIQHYLSLSGLEHYFDSLIGGNMVSVSKPNPEIFIAAADTLGFETAQCIAIEDSFNGIKSAHAAGCITFMVPDIMQPTEDIKLLCHYIFNSLEEIPAYLKEYYPSI